jgi:hypothetical protein
VDPVGHRQPERTINSAVALTAGLPALHSEHIGKPLCLSGSVPEAPSQAGSLSRLGAFLEVLIRVIGLTPASGDNYNGIMNGQHQIGAGSGESNANGLGSRRAEGAFERNAERIRETPVAAHRGSSDSIPLPYR